MKKINLLHKNKKVFVKSGKADIYVEIGYPKKIPAPAIILAHGLRSYFPGFLNNFAKSLREAGYISIKFHFVGTGHSTGLFEDKFNSTMLNNYVDVINYVKKMSEVKGIGVVGRSNAGGLALIHGYDPAVKAYSLLAPPYVYYDIFKEYYLDKAEVKGKYFYHKSFVRPHTKGPGRLPLSFIDELKKYDKIILEKGKTLKNCIVFQSTEDEVVKYKDGHFDYWKKHLSKPNKMVLIKGGNHSFKGRKKEVIKGSIDWFKKFLPTPK